MKRVLPVICIAIVASSLLAAERIVGSEGPAVSAGTNSGGDVPAVALKPAQNSTVAVVTAAPSPPAPALEGVIDGDAQDIIYLAPKSPIFIRLHVQIDGQGFRLLRDAFATELFNSLDADKNGTLEAEEIKQIPPAAQLAPVRQDGQALRPMLTKPVDNAPKDGKVSQDELKQYVREAGGTPFEITSVAQRDRVETNLFERLDLNSDGRLTPEETQVANLSRLWRNDLNDDEFVSSTELDPSGNRFPGVVRQGVADTLTGLATLLMVVDADSASQATIRKMQHLYDKFGKDTKTGFFSKDYNLSAEELGMGSELFGRYDTKHNGTLDNAELREMLRKPVPQVELLVRIPKSGSGKPEFKVLSQQTAGLEDSVSTRAERDRQVQLLLGGQTLDLDMAIREGANNDTVNFYESNFKGLDNDNNGYLDNNESLNFGIPAAAFRIVDRDGDSKIFKEELVSYVKQQAKLASSRMTVNLANTSKTIFELLDENGDNRLGIREFRSIAARVLAWDRDGDGTVTRDEVPKNAQMSFGMGQASIFGRQPIVQRADRRTMVNAASGSASAPKWFSKMDRNGDGDLSSREFLGAPEVFTRLDADHDGLITPKESWEAK